MRRAWSLWSMAPLAALCAIVTLLVPWEPLRILATLPLALFLPGYALTAAAFGAERPDRAREILLGFAMSLALLALGSILLSAVGIYAGSWALLLVVFTAGGCVIAAARRGDRDAPGGGAGARRRGAEGRRRRRLRRRDGAMLAAAGVLASIAVVLTQVPFGAADAKGYAALWMLPGRGGKSVEVGIVSDQQEPGGYVLDVRAASGGRPQVKSFHLDPGDEQIFRLRLPSRAGSGPVKVTASLYRDGNKGSVYRQVVGWVLRGEPT